MRKYIILITVVLFTAASCEKSALTDPDYIIFGSSYGMCAGTDCAVSYMITDEGVSKSSSYLRNGDLSTHNEKLSDEKFEQLKALEAKIPAEFFMGGDEEKQFGCPDCADQGTLHLIIIKGETQKRFRIDTRTDGLPAYVKKMAEEIKAAIAIARQ